MSGSIRAVQMERRLGFKEESCSDLSIITPGLGGGSRRRWKGSQSDWWGCRATCQFGGGRWAQAMGNIDEGMTSANKS